MNEKQFSTKSWHSNLYLATYGRYSGLPTDTCKYYRKILLAILLFIPSIPGYIYNYFNKNSNIKTIEFSFHVPIAIWFGFIYCSIIKNIPHINIFKIYLYGLIFIIIFIILLILLVFLIVKMCDYISFLGYIKWENENKIEKEDGFFKSMFKSFKEKHCSKIKWN